MDRKLRRWMYSGIIATCLLGLVFPNKHPHFWWQKIPVYDALFGFIGCIAIILFSKWLGHAWLMKDEDFYD